MADPIRWQDRWWHEQPDGTWLLFNEETQTWEQYGAAPGGGRPVYAPSAGMSSGAKWAIGAAIALAVLLIIAILAAIAIPVFLRQREKASIDQVEAVLKNAAIAQESYWTVEQTYTDSVDDLESEGLRVPPSVDLFIVSSSANGYCIEARHDLVPNDIWSYDSRIGDSREGPCL